MTSDTIGQMLEQIPVPTSDVQCQQGPFQVSGGEANQKMASHQCPCPPARYQHEQSLLYVQKVEIRGQEPQMTLLCVEDGLDPYKKGCCARPRTPDDLALCGEGDPYNGFTGLTGLQLLTLNRSDPVRETILPPACCPEVRSALQSS
jgi:hypothetical protein